MEAQRLYDKGFKWKDSNGVTRVHQELSAADAPARAMLPGRMQIIFVE